MESNSLPSTLSTKFGPKMIHNEKIAKHHKYRSGFNQMRKNMYETMNPRKKWLLVNLLSTVHPPMWKNYTMLMGERQEKM
jgi:hypothetical protein